MSFYHDGMRELQDHFDGRRVADALEANRLHRAFWEEERALITSTPFFFVASAFGDHVDCSIKSGNPGFVQIVSDDTLEYPEYDGNSMYRTAGNIARHGNVGLLFVRFDGVSHRIRINGRATLHEDAAALARHHGAKLVVRVVCEIFPNCPRYAPDLLGGQPSVHPPRPGYTPPAPPWKSRDYIRDILPERDPHRTG
jgi:predicted pyridoxine 5'-phosphate oxidase superfamily flavin-nucleotide-binding protein